MATKNVSFEGLDQMQSFLAQAAGQMPFAASRALNSTAYQVRERLNQETLNYFDAPKPYTTRAFRYEKATKQNLVATVYLDESRRYLQTQITGGNRPDKKYENYLRSLVGSRLPVRQLVPADLILDNRGNPKRADLRKLGADLNGQTGAIVLGIPKGKKYARAGIYRRKGNKLMPLFVAVDRTSYGRRYPFLELATGEVDRVFTTELSKAVAYALDTAK